MRRARARSAFTLTELLVVIGIIAMLTLMTLPVLGPLIKGKALDGSVSRLQGAIFKARSLAARANANYYLSFNTLDANKHMMVIYQDYMKSNTLIELGGLSDTQWNSAWSSDKTLMLVDQAIPLETGTVFAKDDPGSAEDFIPDDKYGKDRILCFTPTGEVYPYNFDGDGFPTETAENTFELRLQDSSDTTIEKTLAISKWTGEVVDN